MNQPPMTGMPMGPPQGPNRQPPTAQRGQKRASTSSDDVRISYMFAISVSSSLILNIREGSRHPRIRLRQSGSVSDIRLRELHQVVLILESRRHPWCRWDLSRLTILVVVLVDILVLLLRSIHRTCPMASAAVRWAVL